jgi:hypothetical protein
MRRVTFDILMATAGLLLLIGCLHTDTRRAAMGRIQRHYPACSRRSGAARLLLWRRRRRIG